MSWRTIIEVNHDHLGDLTDQRIMESLSRRLASGNPNDERLGHIGHIRIFATRHHSDRVSVAVGNTIRHEE
jgi:hypothetical protein